MEIWFISAVGAALLAGVSNFYFKQAAVRGYNAELFSLYSGFASIFLVSALLVFNQTPIFGYGWLPAVSFVGVDVKS